MNQLEKEDVIGRLVLHGFPVDLVTFKRENSRVPGGSTGTVIQGTCRCSVKDYHVVEQLAEVMPLLTAVAVINLPENTDVIPFNCQITLSQDVYFGSEKVKLMEFKSVTRVDKKEKE